MALNLLACKGTDMLSDTCYTFAKGILKLIGLNLAAETLCMAAVATNAWIAVHRCCKVVVIVKGKRHDVNLS